MMRSADVRVPPGSHPHPTAYRILLFLLLALLLPFACPVVLGSRPSPCGDQPPGNAAPGDPAR